jgi:hypothetical protein
MFVLKECVHIATKFDIWILKGIHDVFELVINYVNMLINKLKYVPCGLFETTKTKGETLGIFLKTI